MTPPTPKPVSMVENPPAFPLSTIDGYGTDGMSLRDWFATHAPAPPMAWWGNGPADCAGYAMWNYQYADHMLRARAAAKGEGE